MTRFGMHRNETLLPSTKPLVVGLNPTFWNMRPKFKSCFRKSDGVEISEKEYGSWVVHTFFSGSPMLNDPGSPYGPDDIGVHYLTDTEADRLGFLDEWKNDFAGLEARGVVVDKSELPWT